MVRSKIIISLFFTSTPINLSVVSFILSGLARAKSQGKTLGRPQILLGSQRQHVLQQLQEGKTIAAIARNFNTSRQTIMRIRNAMNM